MGMKSWQVAAHSPVAMRFNGLDNGTYQITHFYLNNGSTGVIVVPIQTLHIDRAIFFVI